MGIFCKMRCYLNVRVQKTSLFIRIMIQEGEKGKLILTITKGNAESEFIIA